MHHDTCLRPRLALRCLSAALLLATGVGTASATTDEEATTACEQALRAEGAAGVGAVEVRREDRVPYVHGVADFGAAEGVRVRCRVYGGKVTSLRYLVRNPTVSEGWLWTAERPETAGQAETGAGGTGAQAERPQDEPAGQPERQEDETAGAPQPEAPVAPLWRSAGETDFGRSEEATPQPPSDATPQPSAESAAPQTSSESTTPLFLRPPG
jgi:hypothetical protein